MSDRLVTVDIEQRIAWVTFNRPEKRNCMNPALNARMLAVLAELEFREDVGVLVLSGAGEAWSAGMDLYERQLMREIRLTQEQRERNQQYMYQRLFWAVTSTMLLVGLIYEISGKGFL